MAFAGLADKTGLTIDTDAGRTPYPQKPLRCGRIGPSHSSIHNHPEMLPYSVHDHSQGVSEHVL